MIAQLLSKNLLDQWNGSAERDQTYESSRARLRRYKAGQTESTRSRTSAARSKVRKEKASPKRPKQRPVVRVEPDQIQYPATAGPATSKARVSRVFRRESVFGGRFLCDGQCLLGLYTNLHANLFLADFGRPRWRATRRSIVPSSILAKRY
jgi:hypothetical protein